MNAFQITELLSAWNKKTAMNQHSETISLLANLILDCIHREYPNQIRHSLSSDDDLAPPRELHPAFFGSYDWHSAVHGHWSLARVARVTPDETLRQRCFAALDASLTSDKIEGELSYFRKRPYFEMPYGIAWLLLLSAELQAIGNTGTRWLSAMKPLSALCIENGEGYLKRLSQPVRSGQHDQSAFALGLMLDASRILQAEAFEAALIATALRLYERDHSAALHFEPSNHDFLSPALGASDLMRRILSRDHFADWLTKLLPQVPTNPHQEWFPPVHCSDPSDGHLSHRIGLNLSRSWMLTAIGNALGTEDPRTPCLLTTADQHRNEGLTSIDPQHYAGAHWLGTFGIYLLTGGSELPSG